MIDPTKVTNFNRSDAQLEEFLLFSICVAGKNADQQASKLDSFLQSHEPGTPFQQIQGRINHGCLGNALRHVKLGKYQLLSQAFRAVVHAAQQRPIREFDRPLLASLPGVGMKTASFWLLHSFPHQRVAVLDTYALKHLQEAFPKVKVPTSSPQSPEAYMYWETLWIGSVRGVQAYDNLSLAEIDLMLWNHYSLKHRRKPSDNSNNANQLLDPARRGSDLVVAG